MTEQSQTESDSTTADKMHLFKRYSASVLLLLMLSWPMWQMSKSLPVMSKKPMTNSCVIYTRMLLENITEALKQTNLFTGINCSEQNMELNTNTSTPSVCAPKEATCLGKTKLDFNQKPCLSSIWSDLSHYYKFFMAEPNLLSVTQKLRELMENCFDESLPTENKAPANNYNERLSLCKALRGFQVRTITISRAISYMSSGEH